MMMTMMILRTIMVLGYLKGVQLEYTEANADKSEVMDDYVSLVSNVQDWTATSSVFIVFGARVENIKTSTLIHHLLREFSNKQVFALAANLTTMARFSKVYHGRIVRPLVVLLLRSESQVQSFERFTKTGDMANAYWLVLFLNTRINYCSKRPHGNMFHLRFDSRMLVKCYGYPGIKEWWSVNDDKTEVFDLAEWKPKKKLRLKTKLSLHERRHGMQGKVLRVATVNESPFIESESGAMQGLFGKILDELAFAMNFTYVTIFGETAYGIRNEVNGKWTGVVGRLTEGQADIGVAEVTMTGQRLDAVDFTLPLILSRNRLYARPPGGSVVQWSAYHRVFDKRTWAVIIITYMISSLIITIMRLKIETGQIPPGHISENYLCVWGIFCQQGLANFPSEFPLRIAYFCLFITSVVLMSIYSACLISYLTVATPSLPFTDLDGFVKDGSYKLISYLDSADYSMFMSSKNKIIRKMKNLMKPSRELPATVFEGFKQVCASRKVVFYATEAVKNQLDDSDIPCELLSINTGRIDSLGMILSKNSPYTAVFNYHLQKFKDCGIMMRLKTRYSMGRSTQDMKHEPVTFYGVIPILTILLCGILLGIFVFICEKALYSIIFSMCKKKRRKRNLSLKNVKILLAIEKYVKSIP